MTGKKATKKLLAAAPLLFSLACLLLTGPLAFCDDGLVIHASEWVVAKFHRFDNTVHPYPAASAWAPYLPAGDASMDQAVTRRNADGSFSVFFSNLEDLMRAVVGISKSQGRPVSLLNIHGHGLPGTMWFPQSPQALQDWHCTLWQQAAMNSDKDIYVQYYAPETAADIQDIREAADDPATTYACTTGLKEWQEELALVPEFKNVLAADAQIHFLSCVTGMGLLGQRFTSGLAEALLGPNGHIEASVDFGLADWSQVRGMGFWDYQSDAQVDHDEKLNETDNNDSEIAQAGTIRLASFANGTWGSMLWSQRPFLPVGRDTPPELREMRDAPHESFSLTRAPSKIRVPGTTLRIGSR